MVTKTEVTKGSIGEKSGWCFVVYYNNKPYPLFISSMVRTESGAKRNLTRYLKTGWFSWYGNAE